MELQLMTTMKEHTQRMALLNNHTFEALIADLYQMLKSEQFDDARDMVRDWHEAIHGPSDGNAG
jgi:hypothetical protein